ncbi:phage tail tape measure protein, TP901 family, core region [Bacillus thuringiensis]|uniref:phage tail tape measure protein n=1 Tax=Bacillus thuringiensis TaxID=1428 RepID=UPI0018CE0F3E|nr:phage tail tape measure protein [Bacillus thuringiensis]MBG9501707.1 phage tail tape measure protein, TP901 family, core region [Bacillus thuringiensis]MBG9516454.1 phage tail tape measure protein, TP901 family, core region [Bacillus thuringiensis]
MPGNSKERNVVLHFKMDGQVQYANTLKQINMVMNNAAKEYKNHIAAMGQDATMTDRLAAEKKKLEIQMEAAKKRTAMLRAEYQVMSEDTSATAEQLNKMYGKLLDAERAETSLGNAMKRVNEGLSEQAIEARKARGTLLDLQENSRELDAEQKRLTSSFKLQNAELGANASEADKLELAQKQLRQQMEMTDRVIHNLEQQLSAAKRVYGENSTEVQQLETKLNQAKTTLKQFENSLQSVGRSSSQAADGMAEINKKLDMNNLMEAAEVLQGISEKLIEMGKSIVNTAIEFDGSQRKIQASLGLTGKGAENLQKIAVDTWKKGFGENLEEVDNALIKVYQNMRDVPYDELQMASEDVLTLAKVYDVDLNEATRGAGQLMSQFGLSTQETFDLLAAGAQEGLNYSDELFDNLSEYAPLFKQGGFSAQEMFTILANGTKSGSYNLDYINDLVKEFGIRVQDGSKGVSEGFGDLSEETQKVWKSFTEGKGTAADVFNAVLGDLQKMDDKVKANQIGVALFGVKWEDMGAEAVLGLNNVHGGLGDVTGRMDEMKKLQEESLGQQFQKALRETQAALEPLGKKFAELAKDILPPIVDGVKAVMDWFRKLSEADQTLLIVMGALSTAFIILPPIVAALAVSFGALNLAFLPVIATIAAVSLVITGIIMLIRNWGAITDWLSEKWSQFKEWFGELWAGIVRACSDGWSATVEYFSEAWSSFIEMMHEFFDPIGQFFSDLWSGIVETVSSWWSNLVTTASELWSQLTQAWQETWNTILTVLDPIISAISVVLEAGWLLIQAGTQIAWALISKYIIDPITEAYNWCKDQLGDLVFWLNSQWETAKSYTFAAWNLVKQYVIQPVQELWNTTKQKLSDLANWILTNWDTIKSYTLTAWNLIKKYVINPVTEAYNSAKQKFTDLYNSAQEKFDSVKNAAQEKFDAAKRFIVDPIKDAVDKVKGFIDKIKSLFSDLKLKIPKPEMPKMPHFSLQTSTKNILGKDITFPSGIDVQWRAKGGIFTRPTIFGMSNGQLQGAGEAGREAVLPLNKKTLGEIGEGIAATMSTEPTIINIYNPSVRDDRDIDRMVGKIDDALAQKGRNSKIGIGRT